MGRKRQRRQQQRDRISELPADIVDMILGFLRIREAASMAVLSTFWRDRWFSLTNLIFDLGFFTCFMNKYFHPSGYIRTQTTQKKKKNRDIWIHEALYVINKVLNQHNGLIRTFVIEFQYPGSKIFRSRSFDLDQWLLFVTRKGVEEIHLSLMEKDEYTVPDCIFSCLTLRRLHLRGVDIELIDAHCTLPNVTSLSLTIKDCSFNKQLPINSDLRSVRTLDLDTYALKDFGTRRGLEPQPFVLNVEYLEVSELFGFSGDISSGFIHLLQICPQLCKLDIDLTFADVLAIHSEEFHTVAQGLEMLPNLNMKDFVAGEDSVVFIKRLLACFPALEEVVITRRRLRLL